MLLYRQWVVDYSEVDATPTQPSRGKLRWESGP